MRREGKVLKAPGISDDGRGLTLLLAIAKALNEAPERYQEPGRSAFRHIGKNHQSPILKTLELMFSFV